MPSWWYTRQPSPTNSMFIFLVCPISLYIETQINNGRTPHCYISSYVLIYLSLSFFLSLLLWISFIWFLPRLCNFVLDNSILVELLKFRVSKDSTHPPLSLASYLRPIIPFHKRRKWKNRYWMSWILCFKSEASSSDIQVSTCQDYFWIR